MYLRMFFIVATLGLSALPVTNMLNKQFEFNKINDLYSLDSIESIFNNLLMYQGISSNSEQVIIGKEKWFFLGDHYDKIITSFREGGKDSKRVRANTNIVNAQLIWEKWLQVHGVKNYKILIAPNKSTIYPEFLPDWAKSSTSLSDSLFSNDENSIFVDVRKELKSSKFIFPVYFRIGTHWNMYGAGVAYKKFFHLLKLEEKSLTLPNISWYQLSQTIDLADRGLQNMLKLYSNPYKLTLATNIVDLPLEHIIYDFNKKEEVYRGKKPLFGSTNTLSRINTPNALNNKKVLWLSDSFGDSLSYYMTASFTNVLKIHWSELAGTENFQKLIKDWSPDYVFVTIAERSLIYDNFKTVPHMQVNNEQKAMSKEVELRSPKLHDITKNNLKYNVVGADPYLIYDFKKKINGKEMPILAFNLSCTNQNKKIPIQFFWKTVDTAFNEKDNIQFNAHHGYNQLFILNWLETHNINSIRIDLSGKVDCKEFKMEEVRLGEYK